MSKPETVQSLRLQLDFWEEKLSNAKTDVRFSYYDVTLTVGKSIPKKVFCLKKYKGCKLSMFATRMTVYRRERVLANRIRSVCNRTERIRRASRISETKIPFFEAKIALLKERMENLKATRFVLES